MPMSFRHTWIQPWALTRGFLNCRMLRTLCFIYGFLPDCEPSQLWMVRSLTLNVTSLPELTLLACPLIWCVPSTTSQGSTALHLHATLGCLKLRCDHGRVFLAVAHGLLKFMAGSVRTPLLAVGYQKGMRFECTQWFS